MSSPAAAVTRIYRFGLRFSVLKSTRTCSAIQFKAFSSVIARKPKLYGFSSILTDNFVRRSQVKAMGSLSPNDPASYSRPDEAIIRHVDLNLTVDFNKKALIGVALLNFEALKEIDHVILDVGDQKIEAVELADGTKLKYQVDGEVANFGSRMTINLPSSVKPSNKFAVRVKYTTVPTASALQWLEPSQTRGKRHPYLFSQCQPIHARTILPCQDTPAVKFTYSAEVKAPEPYTVLMSALTKERTPTKTTFNQPIPIPSYLLAIAVGELKSKTIGPRTTIWTEAEEVERSAWEFADTENYLKAAERLCGPYVWTQYDLLVLPPSFPYGGMENPCLTFVTPTLLAGDRSQADVIVHEIMHSWTGNLVTNKNFEHFWLNEGFTVFLERKVGASLISDPEESRKSRDFHSLLGLQELSEAVNEQFQPDDPLTKLVPNLSGVHPDDAFSRVPYEKGSLFLRYLEDLIGGPEVFDDFLRAYLNKFQRTSLDTFEFKDYLYTYFKDQPAAEKLVQVNWDAWLYTTGMPPIIPNYDTSKTKAITSLLEQINTKEDFSYEDVKDFSPHQIINFLQEMLEREPLPADKLEALGAAYKIAESPNSEIKYRWLRLCAKSKIRERLPEMFEFVNSQGRMKYIRPIYRDLYAWEAVRNEAIQNFLDNERYMMHVSAYTVRKDLHLTENLLAQQ